MVLWHHHRGGGKYGRLMTCFPDCSQKQHSVDVGWLHDACKMEQRQNPGEHSDAQVCDALRFLVSDNLSAFLAMEDFTMRTDRTPRDLCDSGSVPGSHPEFSRGVVS